MNESETYRHECEVRYICHQLKTLLSRRTYLLNVEEKRGKSLADKLRDDVKKLWYAEKNN